MLQPKTTLRLRKALAIVLLAAGSMLVTQVKASVHSYKKDADGITCHLDKGLMKIKICSPDIVEVKYTLFNTFEHKPSLVVM